MHLPFRFQNRGGKFFRILHRQAQHMKGQPLGCFTANAGKSRELIR